MDFEENNKNNENNPSKDIVKKREPHFEQSIKQKKTNGWKMATLVVSILLVISVIVGYGSDIGLVSGNVVAEDAIDYINTYMLQGQETATLGDVSTENGVVKAMVTVAGQSMPVYLTKDGGLMFLQAIPLNGADLNPIDQGDQSSPEPTTTNIPKSDKPAVEAFVMSHCPYGTQIEKGLLPVVKTLGDKVDFELKFVYYAMHPTQGEVEEELNQYCIQKEQNDKFLDYLECFLTEGDGEGCLASTGIDMSKLKTCTEATDTEFNVIANLEDKSSWLSGKFPLFDIYKADNEKYGVAGSPTLIINGVKSTSGRDSKSLLKAVCDAFNVAPEECNTEFESGTPSPGFGWDETSNTNLATCG